jgi:pimeloyl-ACP methyl ester carboxylesterase
MSRKLAFALVGFGALAALAAAGAADRLYHGLPRFLLWRALSGEAHGGRFVTSNGIPLYYETFGRGPPVLVLHQGLGSAVDMRYQIAALAAAHFVIAPDLRGNGRSGDSAAPLDYGTMANDMVALLDALALPRVDVVGWSDGGIVGLELAMHHPARVRRLVVIGANFSPAGLINPPGPAPAGMSARARKVMELWRTQPDETPAMLGTIRAPTLVMAGEFDLVRRAHTDALARSIRGAREYIVPGATHRAPLTDPDAVNARIVAFLDGETR